MIEPKPIQIEGKEFYISKFPAIQGREIICKYPLTGIPKLGDYEENQKTMFKLMAYVGVEYSGQQVLLTNELLINAHVPSWEMLIKIELAMLEYNCSFFRNGSVSNLLKDIQEKLPAWTIKILSPFLRQSSQKTKRSSKT